MIKLTKAYKLQRDMKDTFLMHLIEISNVRHVFKKRQLRITVGVKIWQTKKTNKGAN